jgi:hypothetical protein
MVTQIGRTEVSQKIDEMDKKRMFFERMSFLLLQAIIWIFLHKPRIMG